MRRELKGQQVVIKMRSAIVSANDFENVLTDSLCCGSGYWCVDESPDDFGLWAH